MLNQGTMLQNRYCILNIIASGGMAIVYLAEDTRLPGHYCAIKEMSPAQLPPQDQNWAINAFRQEAQMLAQLTHPGIVHVSDYFTEYANWYLVMDFIQGQTLEKWLEQYPNGLPFHVALNYIQQVCGVLEFLHAYTPPIIFRDLKPGNVMITTTGEVKLIDFGIARFFKPGQTHNTVNLGTPGYASPEHSGKGQTDPRSDIYSLGVLLHQLLTGHDPGATPFNLPPARQLNSTIPIPIEEAIKKATHLLPDHRFQNVGEFRQAVSQPTPFTPTAVMPGPSSTAVTNQRHSIMLVGLVAVIAIVVFVIYSGTRPSSATPSPAPGAAVITHTFTPSVLLPEPSGSTTAPIERSSPTPVAPSLIPGPAGDASSAERITIPAGSFFFGATLQDIEVGVQLCEDYGYTWCKADYLQDELVDGGNQLLAAFSIDRYEVTNAQYARCTAAGRCAHPDMIAPTPSAVLNPRHYDFDNGRCSNCPVVYVTWDDAQRYCEWTGGRLPNSMEWEKAARGPDGRRWPWGNETPTDHTNFAAVGESIAQENKDGGSRLGGDAAPVGSYPKDMSPYGVMDMAGNVMEWVDAWNGDGLREIRGGSWNTGSYATRVTNRAGGNPNDGYFDIGFRCVYPAP